MYTHKLVRISQGPPKKKYCIYNHIEKLTQKCFFLNYRLLK